MDKFTITLSLLDSPEGINDNSDSIGIIRLAKAFASIPSLVARHHDADQTGVVPYGVAGRACRARPPAVIVMAWSKNS